MRRASTEEGLHQRGRDGQIGDPQDRDRPPPLEFTFVFVPTRTLGAVASATVT